MVAGLLYIVGLIMVVVTIIMVGSASPSLIQAFMTAIEAPNPDYVAAISALARSLSWALWPFISGLLVMGAGRIIFLLGAINRALRGNP